MKFRRVHAIVFLLSLAAYAESSAQPRSDTTVKVATRPMHTGGGSLVRRLTIGDAGAPAEYLFEGIQQVAVLLDGSVCVADGPFSPKPSVRVFGRDGRLIRSIGRVGEGPGEFRSVLGIAQTPDGRIFLQDPGNNRISVYSANGEWLTDRATQSPPCVVL